MLAIYKKELRSYFTSMIGYVFIALFLVIIGVYFFIYNLFQRLANFEYVMNDITFIFVLLVPLLTMRLIAEENKQKTDQLLLTSPLTAGSIVIGKFLAVFTVFLSVMAVTCTYPLIMTLYGKVPMAAAYSSIFGFTMLGGAYLAIGIFLSSLTESQVVAAVISFVVFVFTLLMGSIANMLPANSRTAFIFFAVVVILICLALYFVMHNLTVSVSLAIIGVAGLTAAYVIKPTLFDNLISKVAGWFSVISRYNNFYLGILDLSSIIYYLSIVFLFLFLTIQVIKKKRWS